MNINYFQDNDRFKKLVDTNMTLDNFRINNCKNELEYLYCGIFKEGHVFGKWWKVSFSGTRLKDGEVLNNIETIRSLMEKADEFSITLYPTGYTYFSHLYSTYFIINSPKYIIKEKIIEQSKILDLYLKGNVKIIIYLVS
jgi:hypothetical protein